MIYPFVLTEEASIIRIDFTKIKGLHYKTVPWLIFAESNSDSASTTGFGFTIGQPLACPICLVP
jgi:hypothetical protein